MEPKWLAWAKALQAISQTGLAYAKDPFDAQRYEAIRAVAADIMASHAGASQEFVLDLFTRQAGYATPKVGVRGVVFQEDRLLLVRDAGDGGWTLPGGWADVDESPSEATVREIREESGYLTRPVRLLAVYDSVKQGQRSAFHIYRLFVLCELVGGEAATSLETSEVGFFAEREIPLLSERRVTRGQIMRCFEQHRDASIPTHFD